MHVDLRLCNGAKVKWAAIVSHSTAAEKGKERKGKRERESVCVCVTKWGKRNAKAQQRHYSPSAHGAAHGFLYISKLSTYSLANYP